MRKIVPLVLIAAFAVTACQPEPRTTGEKVDEAISDTGDAIGDAVNPPNTPGEKVGEAVDDTADAVDDAVHE